MKSAQIRSYFWSVFSCIRTRNNSVFVHFLRSAGFKRTINKNKYQSKVTLKTQSPYSDYLINLSFQEVNRLFISLFENNEDTAAHTEYFPPKVQIKDYNVIIDRQKVFDQPIKNDLKTYDNIQKIKSGQGDVYTTGSLLDYIYFKEN